MVLIDILFIVLLVYIFIIVINKFYPPKSDKDKDKKDEKIMNNKMIDKITGAKIMVKSKPKTFDIISCKKPCDKIKDFHNDFFSFRDKIEQNTSIKEDVVDKVLALQLDGNLGSNTNTKNMRIKDIYDDLVCNKEYKEAQDYDFNKCARTSKFDNMNNSGYTFNYGSPGLHLVRDDWKYPNSSLHKAPGIASNEYPICERNSLSANPTSTAQFNEIKNNIYAHDLEYDNNLPYEKLF
jgi:hypothetical protein